MSWYNVAVPSLPVFRSVLFVPGTRADRFDRALASGADAVVFDLEDGVDPARKVDARDMVATWLTTSTAPATAQRLVRVNAAGSPWIDADLAWLARVADVIDAVVVPKAESPADVERVAQSAPSRVVVPLLETARGVIHAVQVLGADADVPAVLFGAEDLTAELGIPRSLHGEELVLARSQVVLAAATVRAEPIDAVWVDVASTEGLREDALRARALGFRGKMAIHPTQVPVINDVFKPTDAEIAAARRVVEAAEAARATGEGAFRLDDRMVDAPVVRRAERVLALARSLGRR